MNREVVSIPIGESVFPSVILFYLDTFQNNFDALTYLHLIRKQRIDEEFPQARAYHRDETWFAEELAKSVDLSSVDAIVPAPSSRRDNLPYYQSLTSKYPDALKLAGYISKDSDYKAGFDDSLEVAIPHYHLLSHPRKSFRSLLVVDDIFSRGLTAAVIFHILEEKTKSHIEGKFIAVALKT